MPKDTFYNLPEGKKRKIFAAAVEEFSLRRFSEVSINQIIKNAEISRGSFYQYFKDKEDLYLYILNEIGKEKMAILSSNALNEEDDFFEIYLRMFEVGLQWSEVKPEYSKIGMLMELDDSDFIANLREMANDGYKMLAVLIERDKERGLIKFDVDADLIIDMLYNLNISLLRKYFMQGNIEELMLQVKAIIKILKEGIATS